MIMTRPIKWYLVRNCIARSASIQGKAVGLPSIDRRERTQCVLLNGQRVALNIALYTSRGQNSHMVILSPTIRFCQPSNSLR